MKLNSIKHNIFFSTCLMCLLAFWGCNNLDVHEWNTPIPQHSWKSNATIKGAFIIQDTSSYYNLYVIIRHTDSYNFNNLWLNAGLQFPGDTMQFKRINLLLGDDALGWEGVGMGDVWEVKKRLNSVPAKFNKKGKYQFELAHIMREDPLQHIVSAGFSIEKISN